MLKGDTAVCHELFKLVVLLSHQHRNIHLILPESVLTHGKIFLGEGHFFCGSCWRSCISHVNYLLRGQELACTPASLFN